MTYSPNGELSRFRFIGIFTHQEPACQPLMRFDRISKIASLLLPKLYWVIGLVVLPHITVFGQPANDNCANASIINISGSGFGLGVFTSSTDDLTAATVQPGETFAPAILVAGQNQKSVWYKFSLPTTRSVRVSLAQPGSLITAGDAGFAVYKTNTCLPAGTELSTKLTPIGVFGNSFHPCVDAGDYLVQVSSKATANGPVYITVETGQPTAVYDLPAQANYFGVLPAHASPVNFYFNVDCQTIDDASEICNTLGNYQDYTKSTWHVFTTPAYLDYLAYSIGGAFSKAGIKIYQGDVRSAPYSSMPVVKTCDSLPGIKIFDCNELSPNTTYSIQLFFNKNFEGNVSFSFYTGGFAPTVAPEPILSAITPTTNNLGVLPATPSFSLIQRNDFLACNSRISLHPCSPSMPAGGVVWGGQRWNLSTFFMFNLSTTSSMSFNIANSNPAGSCGNNLLVRLYQQKVTNNCADLDTANIVAQFIQNADINCLPPGDYTMQVLGHDTLLINQGTLYCIRKNLGTIFDMNINVKSIAASHKFNLGLAGAFDTLNAVSNVMQPMVPGTLYTSKRDTLGCANTVMPPGNCDPFYTKAIYREFIVPDSGIISYWTSPGLTTKIYKGDANALAIAQNAFSYPATITGLTAQTICLGDLNPGFVACDGRKVCVEPGTYTSVTFGATNQIGASNEVQVRFNVLNTVHGTPSAAEDMGDVLAIIPSTGGSVTSAVDYFSCRDNVVTINGAAPCVINGAVATKVIYRQFYLNSDAAISIESLGEGCGIGGSLFSLFRGKATDGLSALTATSWQCLQNAGWNVCGPLTAGWYTIVSYGTGPSYANPTRDVGDPRFPHYSNFVGYGNKIRISWAPPTCPLPKYNRPNKAAIDTITNQPFLIQWGPRVGSTAAYPRTDTTYNLYTENFLCPDTPFAAHPVLSCSTDPGMVRVAYYVFQVTQEAFLRINTNGPWTWTRASVYAGNVRTTPNLLVNTSPIQPCIDAGVGQLMLCNVQPGYYTLVIYASNDMACRSVTPSIYIDRMGYSRFDHANNAYDFGLIPSDSVWHNGKPGDVNPLDPGRAPSNDFFYCTTGSRPDDPAYYCNNGNTYIPQLYTAGINYPIFPANLYYGTFGNLPRVARQNLWYTFTVDKGGWVRIRVNNKTTGKSFQYPYLVMRSDVNGSLPFSMVVSSGAVDSTVAQGLAGVTSNAHGFTCIGGPEVSFYRGACSPIPERYYIVIQNDIEGDMLPNHQVEVSILFDSVTAVLPKYDHYYQAYNIGTNLGPGTYNGDPDNISCATRDLTDPVSGGVSPPSCDRTIWYKFSTTITGTIKMRMYESPSIGWNASPTRIQLFREIIPGDSTSNGLQYIGTNFVNYGGGVFYSEACISPGNYYIILPNCNLTDGVVYPQFVLEENLGDFCTRPVIATLNGSGTSVTSATVNCHTIGTDYGEFNPTLTCPAGAITNQYKTSWFKINITGTDTLDVTTYITENTNASSSQIKYRLMNGDCNAMQERSCVQDALTQDTYKCLAPGEYWVQVFTPVSVSGNPVTGTIDLHLSAVVKTDSCAPVNPCLSNANFQKQFDCNTSSAVRFVNYSTYGSSISYLWNFGYVGQTSTAVSPQFIYPALTTAQTYYITLTVTNNACGGVSTYTDSITIPPRPGVNLGADTSLCDGGSLVLNATSHPGATYLWNNGSTNPTLTVTATGQNNYWVAVTYNGCTVRDTIQVNIDPVSPVTLNNYLCGINPVTLNASRGLGETYYWNTGATSPAITVFSPGTFWCDINLRGCITRDSFIVSSSAASLGNDREVCFAQPVSLNATTTGATGYSWQNGSTNAVFNATTPGLYWVDIVFSNCTLRDSITLTAIQPVISSINASICEGQTYTLPSGTVVNLAAMYSDTTRTQQGCDSLINSVVLSVQPVLHDSLNAVICQGAFYTLPWGPVVNTAGVYRDTLHYVSGCDSVRRIINLTVQQPASAIINAGICAGQNYTLPWGQVVNSAGIYHDTLYYLSGCDSLYRTVNLSIQMAQTDSNSITICSGQSYTLPSGTIVSSAGIYRDTLFYTTGCDSLYRITNLTVQTAQTITATDTICAGQTYTLPWGAVVTASGNYTDTLRYSTTGCDSLYNTVALTVLSSAISITSTANICNGQSYTLPWGAVVTTTGIYTDTIRYAGSGCDSLYTIVDLMVQSAQSSVLDTIICSGQSYTLPWGVVVSLTGTYSDTLHYSSGCDSLYRTVNLTVQSTQTQTIDTTICQGQSYTLPSGIIATTAGVYNDTLYYSSGCDSLYTIVNLTVQSTQTNLIADTICAGQTYALPWGVNVTATGTYSDTLYYTNTGCDSLYTIVDLTVQSSAINIATNTVICEGQNFTLPWGAIVNSTGVYTDTIRYASSGCDSLYTTVNLLVQSAQTIQINDGICAGQSYTLPWGAVVTAPGVYRDTLYYTTGCDSLYRTVTLNVQSPQAQTVNAVICSGQNYTLPGGTVVNSTGIYSDTLYYNTGCDSLYTTVNLLVQSSQQVNIYDTICSGHSYTLPWGAVVNMPGVYSDTLRYSNSSCDSLYTVVDLFVLSSAQSITSNASICAGQTYTLPWGTIVSASGIYTDTTRYASTGCDSLYRVVNLLVQSPQTGITNVTICTGQNYTLPWGTIVNTTGTYRDTLYYISGCDSLYRVINLTVQAASTIVLSPVICAGQTYTLPSGVTVSSSGNYTDTARYVSGCDSLYTIVNLTVLTVDSNVTNASICTGQTYTLPWGATANSTGIYRDTLRYTQGCDSLYHIVNLVVQSASTSTLNPVICAGQTYTLPSGTVVNTAGTYRDTLRYSTGCDSVYRIVNLTVQTTSSIVLNPVICASQSYTLPWGTVVNTTGTFRDTLRYTTGCDSVYRTVNLLVQPTTTITTNPVICQGQTYTLPWGGSANTTGIYRDTLRYAQTNCDSLYRIVSLSVIPAASSSLDASICQGESYVLPWGVTATTSGIYKDTIRSATGCDSLMRTIHLTVKPRPAVSISKSNDINCIIGSAKLSVTGGVSYRWSPAGSLSNPAGSNPTASPTATTTYTVQATGSNGCVSTENITVMVDFSDADNGFLLPSAFTPNGDGKNDCFGVRTWGNISNLKLQIYNRWGQLVFATTDPTKCWDGTYKGMQEGTAVFVYQVSAETSCGPVYRKGTVTLIR